MASVPQLPSTGGASHAVATAAAFGRTRTGAVHRPRWCACNPWRWGFGLLTVVAVVAVLRFMPRGARRVTPLDHGVHPRPTPLPLPPDDDTGHGQHDDAGGDDASHLSTPPAAVTPSPHPQATGGGGGQDHPLIHVSQDFYGPIPSHEPAPSRDPSWVAEQRPRTDDGGAERAVTSHRLQETEAHSMNPPPLPWAAGVGPATPLQMEMEKRLIIGIAMGVHSGKGAATVAELNIIKTLLASFLPVVQPTHIYRFYFAFDHNDPIFEKEAWRDAIEQEATRMIEGEDVQRWHPVGYVTGRTVDSTSLLVTFHWVHCDFSGKPAWAHSDAGMAAYREGADYVYRVNDDTRFPVAPDWVDRFVKDLRERTPAPNLGVVGPYCDQGANDILTHDFTHRTHAAVFGYIYPRSLPDWSSDDWMTFVYQQFDRMSWRKDTPIVHTLSPQKYSASSRSVRLKALREEIDAGRTLVEAWVADNLPGVQLPWHYVDVAHRS